MEHTNVHFSLSVKNAEVDHFMNVTGIKMNSGRVQTKITFTNNCKNILVRNSVITKLIFLHAGILF